MSAFVGVVEVAILVVDNNMPCIADAETVSIIVYSEVRSSSFQGNRFALSPPFAVALV